MSEAIKTKPSLPDDAGLWMSPRKLMMAICVGTPSHRKTKRELRRGKTAYTAARRCLADLQFNDSIPKAFRAVRWRALPRFCQTGGSL